MSTEPPSEPKPSNSPIAGSRPVSYPTRWEADVVVSDGGSVHVRPIRPDDADRLVRFHHRQSPESIYFRFFGPHPRLTAREVTHLTTVDYRDRMAFVAMLGDEIVGIGRYEPWGDDALELAFFIDDAHHSRGLATLLLEYLMVAARESGFRAAKATVLPSNNAMLAVFRRAGFTVSSEFADGVVEVSFDIEPTAITEAAIAERARRAEARSVARLLRPASVAVIGAGRRRGTLGHEVFTRLLSGWFEGPVYPVNDRADVVRSVRAYRSILDVPEGVDLAVIAVPAGRLDAVIDECARKGVDAVVVLTGGTDGAQLAARARGQGVRVLGPGSVGVLNNDPAIRLHALAAEVLPEPGGVGLSVESASLGAAVLAEAAASGVGISTFVGLGDKVDFDASDVLRFWEEDEATSVIALYLEQVSNPRRFFAVARAVALRKPIVAMSMAGWDDAGPLGRTSELYSELLRQAGIIEVSSLGELFDTVRLLDSQPSPAGNRLAVVSNAAGPAGIAAAAAGRAGLDPVSVDVVGPLVTPRAVAYAVTSGLQRADAAIVVLGPPTQGHSAETAQLVAEVAAGAAKPVLAAFLGEDDPVGPIPTYRFPEDGIRALANAVQHSAYARNVSEPESANPPRPAQAALDEALVLAAVEAAVVAADADGVVPLAEAGAVLAACGLSVASQSLAHGAAEAGAAAAAIGYPVALKALGRSARANRLENGLVLDVGDRAALDAMIGRMQGHLGAAATHVLVQEMAPPGVAVMVRAMDLDDVGPVVALARGGVDASHHDEVAVHLAPLGPGDGGRLVAASGLDSMLDETELGGLFDLVERLGLLLDLAPAVAAVRLDPVLVSADGAWVTDYALTVQPVAEEGRPVVRRRD